MKAAEMKLPVLSLILLNILSSSAQKIHLAETNVNSSFRALSVVDDSTAWVAGSNGHVGRSTDGGKTWVINQISGYSDMDFRSLHAKNSSVALIVSAGSPGIILHTMDGGRTWTEVYRDTSHSVFIDGICFCDIKTGYAYGDPVDGKLYLLKSATGGFSWEMVPYEKRPAMSKGEASFAASGTGILCKDNKLMISTGGSHSRLLSFDLGTEDWEIHEIPVVQGEASEGIYSFDINEKGRVIAVGGDYTEMEMSDRHVFYSDEPGSEWIFPEKPTRGYMECVQFISNNTALAVGPLGIDITTDGGKTWDPYLEAEGYHVMSKSADGKLILIAGRNGQIARLVKE